MIYTLTFDMDRIDPSIKAGTNTIFAEKSNLDDIDYEGFKRGWVRYCINQMRFLDHLPKIQFFYSSIASNLESDYLLNSYDWPLVHERVKEEFTKHNIEGIQYIPIELIDVVSNQVNRHYYALNILNSIDAIDMTKSRYDYEEEYDAYFFEPMGIYYDEKKCEQHSIFRDPKDPFALCVTDAIKEMTEKNEWIGFYFYLQKTI